MHWLRVRLIIILLARSLFRLLIVIVADVSFVGRLTFSSQLSRHCIRQFSLSHCHLFNLQFLHSYFNGILTNTVTLDTLQNPVTVAEGINLACSHEKHLFLAALHTSDVSILTSISIYTRLGRHVNYTFTKIIHLLVHGQMYYICYICDELCLN